MEDQIQPSDDVPSSKTGRAVKLALIGAGIAAGAIGATALGANAATDTPSSSSTTTSSSSSTAAPDPRTGPPGGHGQGVPGGRNPDEQAVSADLTAKLKAAALKAVPGGTVDRVETDSGDAAYEAHMTKSDGTKVTVKFDKNYNVTGVEDGMGK